MIFYHTEHTIFQSHLLQSTLVKTHPCHQFLLQYYFYWWLALSCLSIHCVRIFPVKRSLQIPTKVILILSLVEPGWSYPLKVNMCFKIVPSFDSDTPLNVSYYVKAAPFSLCHWISCTLIFLNSTVLYMGVIHTYPLRAQLLKFLFLKKKLSRHILMISYNLKSYWHWKGVLQALLNVFQKLNPADNILTHFYMDRFIALKIWALNWDRG